MRKIAFTLFLGLLAACGAGFAVLAIERRLLPLEVADATLQFEFLAVGALFLLWGILQLALDETKEAAPEKKGEARTAVQDESLASVFESRAARLNRRSGRLAEWTQDDDSFAPRDTDRN